MVAWLDDDGSSGCVVSWWLWHGSGGSIYDHITVAVAVMLQWLHGGDR